MKARFTSNVGWNPIIAKLIQSFCQVWDAAYLNTIGVPIDGIPNILDLQRQGLENVRPSRYAFYQGRGTEDSLPYDLTITVDFYLRRIQ